MIKKRYHIWDHRPSEIGSIFDGIQILTPEEAEGYKAKGYNVEEW